ncbi:hypothetical protein KY290_030708 [Solanum tuberosum]|uniref:Uncharacterized protein n=1 Tax=Solanum tuberosum TaxID=4113 RepID=A0ABQ7UAL5_SOLTU|nr:hypothetical protein KY290_030708 [Solanum tuberosum]
MDTQDPTNNVVPPQDHNNANLSEPSPTTVVPSCNGRVIIKPIWHALLGESFDRIPKELMSRPKFTSRDGTYVPNQ